MADITWRVHETRIRVHELIYALQEGHIYIEDLDPALVKRLSELLKPKSEEPCVTSQLTLKQPG